MIEKLVNGDHLKRLDNIVQWLEQDGFNKESVSEHSFKVAVFTRAILEDIFGNNNDEGVLRFKLDCVTHALHHDFDEAIFLRDISHDIKYNKFNGEEIRHVIDDYVKHKFDEDFGDESTDCYRMMYNSIVEVPMHIKPVVKLADWLALFYHCKREVALGNERFMETLVYCRKSIKESVENVIGSINAVFGRDFLADYLSNFRRKIYNIVK